MLWKRRQFSERTFKFQANTIEQQKSKAYNIFRNHRHQPVHRDSLYSLFWGIQSKLKTETENFWMLEVPKMMWEANVHAAEQNKFL